MALALKSRICLYEGTYRKYHNLNLDGHDANFYLDLLSLIHISEPTRH